MKNKFLFLSLLFVLVAHSCKVNYSFTGASIDPSIQTVSIQRLNNNASLVVPTLSQTITEGLRDKMVSQSGLKLVTGKGDIHYEGEIVRYEVNPAGFGTNETASLNRLTISVNIRHVNTKKPELSWEQQLVRYSDFDAKLNFTNVENQLITEISKQIVDDIFNKTFGNW